MEARAAVREEDMVDRAEVRVVTLADPAWDRWAADRRCTMADREDIVRRHPHRRDIMAVIITEDIIREDTAAV